MRFNGGEGVAGHGRVGACEGVKHGAFASVGQSNNTDLKGHGSPSLSSFDQSEALQYDATRPDIPVPHPLLK
jgi:hypothetical protein